MSVYTKNSDNNIEINFKPNESFAHTAVTGKQKNKVRKTTFMTTLNNADVSPVSIQQMLESGLNIIRFRATSSLGDQVRLLAHIREAAENCRRKYKLAQWPVATAITVMTCMVRTGVLVDSKSSIQIELDSQVILTNNKQFMNQCSSSQIYVDNPHLTQDVTVGDVVSIEADAIVLKCEEFIDNQTLKCRVITAGPLYTLSTVCVRGGKYTQKELTEDDLRLLQFALDYGIDIIFLQYVRNTEILDAVKAILGPKHKRPLIFSSINTPDGLKNLDDILKQSDGVEFTRDLLPFNLGLTDTYRWMQIQKWVFAKCHAAGIPCFISGAVVPTTTKTGSIVDNEFVDISNALFDGATGISMNDCDNIEHTIDIIRVLHDVCLTLETVVEERTDYWKLLYEQWKLPVNAAEGTILGCVAAAIQTQAKAIVVPSVTGRTVRSLMKLKPPCLIIVVNRLGHASRMLYTYRGVMPVIDEGECVGVFLAERTRRVLFGVHYAVARGFIQYGDNYVVLTGSNEYSCYCDIFFIHKTTVFNNSFISC